MHKHQSWPRTIDPKRDLCSIHFNNRHSIAPDLFKRVG